MKKILLILFTLIVTVGYSQHNWVAPGDSIIVRNLKITAFPTSTNGSRSLRVNNNGAVMLDTLAYSDIPVISSFIDKSRTCNSSRDDKDAFVTAFAATNKLIVDDGCYYINSTLTIPAGKTLIFEPGGMISGTGTITGNETEIQAGLTQIFSTSLTVSGFKVKEAYPEWFGAKNDSTTDNYQMFLKTFYFANTAKCRIQLQAGRYYISQRITLYDKDLSINGQGKFKTYIETNMTNPSSTYIFIRCSGSLGDTTSLTKTALRGLNYISVRDGSIFKEGDLVNIKSDSASNSSDPSLRWGEYKHIQKVDGNTVYFNEGIIFERYTASGSKVTKVNPVNVHLSNLSINNRNIDENNNTVGFMGVYTNNAVFENVAISNFIASDLTLWDGYNLYLSDYYSQHANQYWGTTNNGYGLKANGITHADIQGLFLNHRHCISTGGTENGGTFYLNIHDSYFASKRPLSMVDAHPTNDYTTINNCTFVGMSEYDKYDASTTYSKDDTLYYDDALAVIAKVNSPGDPMNDNSRTDWRFIPSSKAWGVAVSGNFKITNNKFYNLVYLVYLRANYKSVQFNNNKAYNCNSLFTSDIYNVDFYANNNQVINKYYYDDYFMAQATDNTNDNVIDGLYAKNINLLYNTGVNKINNLRNITIDNTNTYRDTTLIISTTKGDGTSFNIDGLTYNGHQSFAYISGDSINILNANITTDDEVLFKSLYSDTVHYMNLSGNINFTSTNDHYMTYVYPTFKTLALNCNITSQGALYIDKYRMPRRIIWNGSSSVKLKSRSPYISDRLSRVFTSFLKSDTLPDMTSNDYGYTYYHDTLWFWNGSGWKITPLTTP